MSSEPEPRVYHVAIFDNPSTAAREEWINGGLHDAVAMTLLYSKTYDREIRRLGRDVPPDFHPGRCIGSMAALPEDLRALVDMSASDLLDPEQGPL